MSVSAVLRPKATRAVERVAAAALGASVLAASVLAASAAAQPATQVNRLAGDLSAPQGQTITISGHVSISAACPATTAVQLTSSPNGLFANNMGPTAQRDAGGNFSVMFMIPLTTPAGAYAIGVKCGSAAAASSETLNVTAVATAKASISVSPASAAPGASVTVSGAVPVTGTAACVASDTLRLTGSSSLFPPDGFGPDVVRDATGKFKMSYTIPAATSAGKYSIGLRCGGGNVGVSANLTVNSSTTTTTTTTTAVPTTTTPPTTAPSTTISTPATSILLPTTSTTTAPKKASSKSNVRWIALALLAVVVLGAILVLFTRR